MTAQKKTPPVRAAFPIRRRPALERRAAAPHEADDRRDGEEDDRDEEDQLRDVDGGAGNSAEAEDGRHEGDDQERNSPADHGGTSLSDRRTADDGGTTPTLTTGSTVKVMRSERNLPAGSPRAFRPGNRLSA